MQSFSHQISRLRAFTKFGNKMSYGLMDKVSLLALVYFTITSLLPDLTVPKNKNHMNTPVAPLLTWFNFNSSMDK